MIPSSHFRRRPRPALSCIVRFRTEGQGPDKEREALTQDLGLGGAFILTDEDIPEGEKLTLTIQPPDDPEPIVVWAVVKWRSDGSGDRPKGVGIQFEQVGAETLANLNDFIASLVPLQPADPSMGQGS